MKLDVTTIQLLILATPGLIWALLESSFRHHNKFQQFIFTIKALVYGLICFTILGLIYKLNSLRFHVLDFAPSVNFPEKLDEIGWSIVIAVGLAIMSIANRNYGWFVKFLRNLGATDYTGTDDIWEYALGLADGTGEYVYIRDFENELVYRGLLAAYSEGSEAREILLEDVDVYDLDSKFMFDLDRIYLTFAHGSERIEFPVRRSVKNDQPERQRHKAPSHGSRRKRPRESRTHDITGETF